MKKIIILGLLCLSTQAFSNVISKLDAKNKCTLYTVLKGDEERNRPLAAGEKLVINKQVYGMAFKNMTIDFDNRMITLDLMANVVFGINARVKEQVILTERHPDFHELSNQVNQKLYLLNNVCINSNNEIVHANFAK